MTTKPRAKKFRISRSTRAPHSDPAGAEGDAATQRVKAATRPANSDAARPGPTVPRSRNPNPMEELAQSPTEDGFPKEGFRPKGIPANAAVGDGASEDDEAAAIAAIQKEGLTGRQLRMARRVAQKHGVAFGSDYEAVYLLRKAGIDPFKRSNMLELVGADGGGKPDSRSSANLPQTRPMPQLPANHVYDDADRARSIREIQLDIARRRRRKLRMLFLRLAFFVFLPTLVAGIYYYKYATPMYATKTEFVIQKADGAGGSGLGGLFAGSGLATSQDSITVQSYLTSRDAMLRLDGDIGYKSVFSDPDIDPIQRLDPDATNEAAYKLYKKNVKIGFDPTEGIIKMEVVAPTPEQSATFSEVLISYAEERVDNLTQRLREDQMEGAIESYEKAERDMLDAQAEVLRLQEEMGVFDATSDASALMSQITGFESQLQEKRLSLQQLLDNTRPNQARVDGLRGDIGRLETLIAELRGRLTETGGEYGSLASISGRLRIAQTNLETRTVLMQQSLQQLENARIEANKQTRYLELGVRPVAPDEPTYPKSFENTLLAFLIFSGLYLMASITASILREQVSS
ncbi:capsule biosynthesis protein [Aliiroseovarius sp. S2029]|uniref:capsule biosynthesis protein n=1 Tax=Aliiroseovarius sp. S2029 TaxID=2936988 RepID=UPI0020BE86D6|nr:capsule biosynthesis protein [Aliiroseovarius sp. S2029]MCK8482798.1 capsule biosynthesis protein [Aliiroseovarius sp. S2029]